MGEGKAKARGRGAPRRWWLRRIARGLGLPALCLLASGCASVLATSERTGLIRRVISSTVQVRGEREDGWRVASGIVVPSNPNSNRSWILTTRHFLDSPGPPRVFVRSPLREGWLKATVMAVSPDADLAVLAVEGPALPPVEFKEIVRLGDEVWVVAFPWGRRLTVVSGVVSQIASEEEPKEEVVTVEGPARMVDASVSYGASGGGVFDATSGALIGIVEGYRTARVTLPQSPKGTFEVPVPGETTVIPSRTILRFLATFGSPP